MASLLNAEGDARELFEPMHVMHTPWMAGGATHPYVDRLEDGRHFFSNDGAGDRVAQSAHRNARTAQRCKRGDTRCDADQRHQKGRAQQGKLKQRQPAHPVGQPAEHHQ